MEPITNLQIIKYALKPGFDYVFLTNLLCYTLFTLMVPEEVGKLVLPTFVILLLFLYYTVAESIAAIEHVAKKHNNGFLKCPPPSFPKVTIWQYFMMRLLQQVFWGIVIAVSSCYFTPHNCRVFEIYENGDEFFCELCWVSCVLLAVALRVEFVIRQESNAYFKDESFQAAIKADVQAMKDEDDEGYESADEGNKKTN